MMLSLSKASRRRLASQLIMNEHEKTTAQPKGRPFFQIGLAHFKHFPLVQNTVIQIDILMLSRIAKRMHQATGRFGAAGLGKGELTDLKRLGQCFFLNSRKYRKNSGLRRGFSEPHPPGCTEARLIIAVMQTRELPASQAGGWQRWALAAVRNSSAQRLLPLACSTVLSSASASACCTVF